jgi:DNA-binding IclR family transcriptional regulator
MRDKLTKSNQSIEKALQIIEVLARQNGAMRLQDLSVATDIPAPTLTRLLKALGQFNYITQDDQTLKYSLTLKFAQIGSMVKSQFSISEVARPFLVELSRKCAESVCLAVEQDEEVVYIDSVDGPDNMLKTMQRIGKRAPLYSTGVGKLMLLNYDIQRLDSYVAKTGLRPLTVHSISTKEALLKELEAIERNSFAVDNEECELGARCVAAPIRDYSGLVIASISASGPAIRMTDEKIQRIKDYIIETAAKISRIFAYGE